MAPTDIERLMAKVEKHPDGCWLWTACKLEGYGQFRFEGKTSRAHRVAYRLLVGPIPEGLTIDHLCRNPSCVNPEHLEPVTMAENLARGEQMNAARFQLAKTHCPAGHPYDEANTSFKKEGWRRCKTCTREAAQRRRDKMREAA